MSEQKTGKSVLAIIALIIAIFAILGSFIPIINNAAFIVAVISLILGIIAWFRLRKSAKSGKGIAIGAIVISILAMVITLALQAFFVKTIEDATEGPSASGVSNADGSSAGTDVSGPLSVGQSLELENGVSIALTDVTPSLTDDVGDQYVGVTVTYTNNGSEKADFNQFDWKGTTAAGVEEDPEYPILTNETAPRLESGSLNPGGSVTGTVYFKTGTTTASYFGSIFSNNAVGTWNLQ